MNPTRTNEGDEQSTLPEAAWITALLSLAKMGPRRLDALIELTGSARSGWERIRTDASLRVPNTSAQISRTGAWQRVGSMFRIDGGP